MIFHISSSYRPENTACLHQKGKVVNVVEGNNRCLSEPWYGLWIKLKLCWCHSRWYTWLPPTTYRQSIYEDEGHLRHFWKLKSPTPSHRKTTKTFSRVSNAAQNAFSPRCLTEDNCTVSAIYTDAPHITAQTPKPFPAKCHRRPLHVGYHTANNYTIRHIDSSVTLSQTRMS